MSITTDIIAGFPGESEKDFEEAYKFLSEIELSKMHIFKYSPRKGTKAAEMMLQVDGNIKEKRSEALIALSDKLENQFMSKFIGRTMKVLYEEESKELSNHYVGYTPNYIKVIAKSDENLQGKIVETKLEKVEDAYILGAIK